MEKINVKFWVKIKDRYCWKGYCVYLTASEKRRLDAALKRKISIN